MDYTKQIFEMLGVEPEEEFKIKGKNNALPYLYKFTEKLETYSYDTDEDKWRRLYTGEILKDVLNGTYKIVKILCPTAEEQLAIDYARASHFNWLGKNKNKSVYMFTLKPSKGTSCWNPDVDDVLFQPTYIPISFIHWEDEEPFYIGD